MMQRHQNYRQRDDAIVEAFERVHGGSLAGLARQLLDAIRRLPRRPVIRLASECGNTKVTNMSWYEKLLDSARDVAPTVAGGAASPIWWTGDDRVDSEEVVV